MAVTNFIPQIWEARLLAKFHERSITDLITTAPTKVEGNKIIFNPSIEDPDEALDYYRILFNDKRNPYLGEPIEVTFDTTGLAQIEFDMLISYNLNDGKGKIETTEHVVHKLKVDESTTPEVPTTGDDKKKGCKKDLSLLVIGMISLSTLGVILKKREK